MMDFPTTHTTIASEQLHSSGVFPYLEISRNLAIINCLPSNKNFTGDDDYVFVPCDQHDVNATICVLATCPNQTNTKDHILCSISDVKSSSLFFLDGTNDLVFQGNGPNSTIMYSVHLEVETGELSTKASLCYNGIFSF